MSVKIKTGDTVRVIAGKDKDKEGKVLELDLKNNRVTVEGVNMVTKHAKATGRRQEGGIIHREAPIDLSNVMYLYKGKPVRVGYKMEDGKKVRIARPSGDVID